LEGGAGNDILDGGKGADRYVFRLGDGVDRVADSGGADGNGILFGAGITSDMLSLDLNTLTLKVGEAGDAIQLGAAGTSEGEGFGSIDYLQFADGTTLLFEDFLVQTLGLSDGNGDPGPGDSTGDTVTSPEGNTDTAAAAGQGVDNSAPVTSVGAVGAPGSDASAGNSGVETAPDSALFSPGSTGTDPVLTWWPQEDGQARELIAVGGNTHGTYAMRESRPDEQNDAWRDSQLFPGSILGVSSYRGTDGRSNQAQRNDLSELLDSYLTAESRLNIDLPASNVGQGFRRNLVMTPAEIAKRWETVGRYTTALAEKDDEDARNSAGEYRLYDSWNFMAGTDSGGAFGFAGATGVTRGMANMKTLQSLSEGFVRLTA